MYRWIVIPYLVITIFIQTKKQYPKDLAITFAKPERVSIVNRMDIMCKSEIRYKSFY